MSVQNQLPPPAAPAQPATPLRVALFGECMLELVGQAFGPMHQGYGGDTLNTAVYLARCTQRASAAADASVDASSRAPVPVQVQYATALGDDPFSDGLAQRWAADGLGLDLVRRLPGRLPGLYLVQVDGRGERHFSYWRDQAAAKAYFDTDATHAPTPLEATPRACDWLYFSGISLAILPPAGRQRLLALAARLRAEGARVVFDNNYRPRLWPDAAQLQAAYQAAFAVADVALLTLDDHQAFLGAPGAPLAAEPALANAMALAVPEVVVKRGAAPTLWRLGQQPWQAVATEPVAQVVDTTAAGDAFGAGYLARRLAGASPAEAAAFGNRLAARVVQHRGAVIPVAAMADLMPGG